MSQTQEPIVCPICMDDLIPNTKNFTNTECGHCFHASCLMTNIRHNGFGCPYCREEMVEEHNEFQDDQSEISYITQDPVELYDDTALTTMRMLFQQVEGEEVEEPQVEEETLLEEQEEEEPIPPLDMIIRKLIGNRVTYEDLVKHVLLEHEEFKFNEDFETSSDKIFSTVRILVSNFGQQTTQLQQQPEPRFRNIFTTTTTMPDFASMTTEDLKKICQDYGIRYRMSTAVSSLTSIWRTHNE